MRFETGPGEQAQVDYGQIWVWIGAQLEKVHLFVFTLGYSRRLYSRGYQNERLSTLLDGHQRAFAWFGGVTVTCLYDNPRTLVLGRSENKVLWHPLFEDCARYYGFTPRACQPHRPRTKGKVESGVKYVKRNALAGRRFNSWDELNGWLERWSIEVADLRIHGTTHERPIDRYAREQLTPLGIRPPYHYQRVQMRQVANDALVMLGAARYSVPKDRQAINLGRHYSLQQVEYCRNMIFRRNFPIHKLFERSCDLGLLRLSADRIAQVFGWRLHKRLAGQLSCVLEKTEHGHHVLRAYAKNAMIRMYEKFSTFLRLEALSNNLKDFGLNKGLDNLDQVRHTLAAVTDRFAAFEAQALNVHVDFPLFQRLALPVPAASGRVPGIKFHDTRMLRLMEVLLHAGTKVLGWRTAEIHHAIVSSFGLTPATYTLTQLRYDLRKMNAHGLLQRDGRRYAYRLTDKGTRVALLFVLFHQRVCGPLAHSLFHRPALQTPIPMS